MMSKVDDNFGDGGDQANVVENKVSHYVYFSVTVPFASKLLR